MRRLLETRSKGLSQTPTKALPSSIGATTIEIIAVDGNAATQNLAIGTIVFDQFSVIRLFNDELFDFILTLHHSSLNRNKGPSAQCFTADGAQNWENLDENAQLNVTGSRNLQRAVALRACHIESFR